MKLKKKLAIFFTTMLLMMFLFTSVAFAATGSNPGVSIGNWLMEQAQGLVLGLIAIGVTFMLFKKQVINLLVFIAISVVVLFLVFAGSSFKDAVVGIVKNIFGI